MRSRHTAYRGVSGVTFAARPGNVLDTSTIHRESDPTHYQEEHPMKRNLIVIALAAAAVLSGCASTASSGRFANAASPTYTQCAPGFATACR